MSEKIIKKERYEIVSVEVGETSIIFDNKKQQKILTLENYFYDEICKLINLLNEQDKHIEELEKTQMTEEPKDKKEDSDIIIY